MSINIQNEIRGIAMMASSSVLFALVAGLLRYASEVDVFTAALFRFAVGIALLGTAAMANRITLTFVRSRLLFIRGFLGGAGVVLFYLSIQKIGLAKAAVIGSTYPIFAAMISALFLHERISLYKWALILIAFAGIYITVMGNGSIQQGMGRYELLALLGALVAGVVVVLIKILRETESASAIFCAQSAIGFWLVLLPSHVGGGAVSMRSGLVLLIAAVLAAGAQLLMTWSYRHVPVSTGALLSLMTPALSVLIGISLFGEPVTTEETVGIAIVLGSCVSLVVVRR